MNFFVVSQDGRISNNVEPIGVFSAINVDAVQRAEVDAFDDMPIQILIKEKEESEYLDFIEKPVLMISEKMKQVFEMYQKDIFFKPVVLTDTEKMMQVLYWLTIPQKVKCLSKKSEFNKDGSLRKLVIDSKKASLYKVFKIDGILEDFIIVNTDIAESMLRRDLYGFLLRKIDNET